MLAGAMGVAAVVLLVTPASAGTVPWAVTVDRAALPAWPASPGWQRYVQAPASPNLTPARVVGVSGNVTNPGGIVAGGRLQRGRGIHRAGR